MTHTITDAELAQLRDALEYATDQSNPTGDEHCSCPICHALTLLSEIAARTQEPVAWTDGEGNFCVSTPECCGCSIPLYATPQPASEDNIPYKATMIFDHGTKVVEGYISGGVKKLGDFKPLQVQPAAVPEGWALVPVEPTPEMLKTLPIVWPYLVYKKLLAAASKEAR